MPKRARLGIIFSKKHDFCLHLHDFVYILHLFHMQFIILKTKSCLTYTIEQLHHLLQAAFP